MHYFGCLWIPGQHSKCNYIGTMHPPQSVRANFFVSPQIANPQIIDLITQFHIRRFLGCCSCECKPQCKVKNLGSTVCDLRNLVRKPQFRMSQKLPHLRKIRWYNKCNSPEICGFEFCGTYLRTAHPWVSLNFAWPALLLWHWELKKRSRIPF